MVGGVCGFQPHSQLGFSSGDYLLICKLALTACGSDMGTPSLFHTLFIVRHCLKLYQNCERKKYPNL